MNNRLLSAVVALLASTFVTGCDHPLLMFGPWTIASIQDSGQPVPGACDLILLPTCPRSTGIQSQSVGREPVEIDTDEPRVIRSVEIDGLVDPTQVDFGAVPVGTTLSLQVLVRLDEGFGSVEVVTELLDGEFGFEVDREDPEPLVDGDELLFRITFRPEFEDSATDALLIEVEGESRRIELVGRGDSAVPDGTNEEDEEAA